VNGPRVNYEQIARDVCKEVGYDDEAKGLDYKTMSVLVNVEG
jgi:S-adenosylmethionine synthetase